MTRPVPRSRTPPRTFLHQRIGVDTRALAALRIAMGSLILIDLFYRSLNVTAFYTDHGVLPRSALDELRPMFRGLSLNALSGDLWLQVVLLILLGLSGVALAAGFRTRTATIMSLVLLGSLHARNPFILNSGDSLLLLLLFWGAFLPLGARWSVDALRSPGETKTVADVAGFALLLQVVLIYSMNAYFKIEAGHWSSGEAMQYTFNIDRFSTPLGRLLAHAPPLLVAAGWGWLALLCVSVLLIATTGRTRTLLVAAFACVHFGMLLFMRLGVFPLVSMAALLPFLPPRVWDRAETWIHSLSMKIRDKARAFQDDPEDASAPAPSLGLDWMRRARAPAVSVFLLLLVFWSGFSLGVVALPGPLDESLSGHERGWAMFANPSRANVWYVAPAQTLGGEQVDALHGDETPWEDPAHVDPLYPDIRWRKYLAEFHRLGGGDLPEHFAAWLCHRWDAAHDDPLQSLTIYRVDRPIELTHPDPPATREVLIDWNC